MHAVGSSGVTHVAGRGRRSSCRWVVADLRAGHYVRSEEGQEAVAGGKPRDIEAALLPRLPDVCCRARAMTFGRRAQRPETTVLIGNGKKGHKSLSARSRALWLLLLGEPTRSPTTDRLQIDQQPSADQPTMIRRYPGHSPAFVSLRAALSALRSTREALRRSRTLRSLVRRRRGGAGTEWLRRNPAYGPARRRRGGERCC